MSRPCPAGHPSDESDYCSVCGLAMGRGGAPAGLAGAPRRAGAGGGPGPSTSTAAACPVCSEPRADTAARFCEVCRYDFHAKTGGGRPTSAAPPPTPSPKRWRVVVTVDAALDTEPDAAVPCPVDSPAVTIDVTAADLLVGRRDDQRDIRPDIPLGDPGASRRHAKLLVEGARLHLQDLASTNGTKLNGVDVAPGSRTALEVGDEVTLGRWTRIRVEAS